MNKKLDIRVIRRTAMGYKWKEQNAKAREKKASGKSEKSKKKSVKAPAEAKPKKPAGYKWGLPD